MKQCTIPVMKDALLEYYYDSSNPREDMTLIFMLYPRTEENLLDSKIKGILQLNEFIFMDLPKNFDKSVQFQQIRNEL